MKKQIIIFSLTFICLQTYSQNSTQNPPPCTDAIAQNTNGRWIKYPFKASSVSPSEKQEISKRLELIQDILSTMYPQPIGVDIRLNLSANTGYFGATRKYTITADERITWDYLKVVPIVNYFYSANFSPHYCQHNEKGIVFMPGEKNENSDGINIKLNTLAGIVDESAEDDWTINGLPVLLRIPLMNEKLKSEDLYGDARSRARHVIIHRSGMLPYIPVTRKQYLDRCIVYTERLFTKMINMVKETPVRSPEVQEAEKKAKLDQFHKQFGNDPKKLKDNIDYYLAGYRTDQQIRDGMVASQVQNKEKELKKFTDELEKTTNEGLLNSPAIIQAKYYNVPFVFEPDSTKGFMLVTENPNYIRKDLPKYIPQFIVLSWTWNPEFYPVHDGYEKLLLKNFPIEKLQAMIDK